MSCKSSAAFCLSLSDTEPYTLGKLSLPVGDAILYIPMSPLVEQIIQRLDLLPEHALRRILTTINSLLDSTANDSDKVELKPCDFTGSNTNMPNLLKREGIWIVKASKQSLTDYNELISQAREERIDKFTQW